MQLAVNTSLAAEKQASSKTKQNYPTYGDWSVISNENQSFVSQVLTTTGKDGKKHFLAEYKIGYFGPNANLQILIVTPLGVNIVSGLSLVVDGVSMLHGGYLTCGAAGCISIVDITKDIISKMTSAKKVNVNFAFYNIEKRIELTLSNKGLKESISKIKAPNVIIEKKEKHITNNASKKK